MSMITQKESFEQQKLLVVPEDLIRKVALNPLPESEECLPGKRFSGSKVQYEYCSWCSFIIKMAIENFC